MEESIFQHAFIPRQLHDVVDFERAQDCIAVGGAEARSVYHETISGMVAEQPPVDSEAQGQDSLNQQTLADISRDGPSPEGDTVLRAAVQHKGTYAAQSDERSLIGSSEEQPADPRSSIEALGSAEAPIAADDAVEACTTDTGSDAALSDDESEHCIPVAASKEDRKLHKKAVKEAARERRKTKIPKHVKKRATKHK